MDVRARNCAVLPVWSFPDSPSWREGLLSACPSASWDRDPFLGEQTDRHTNMTVNITFPRTTYVVGKYNIGGNIGKG